MPDARAKDRLGVVTEEAHFLAPLSDRLTDRWASQYLEIFGRNAFFPETRVRKLFGELVRLFIECLKANSLDLYFEDLSEKGRLFSRLGVPFEEIILSLHLFEETCLEQFLLYYRDRSRLPELVRIMEELHSEGLAVFASSYFETTKSQLESLSQSLREENETLRGELERARESVFSLAQNELKSMQLILSGVNQKLKSRVYQLGRIQRVSDSLDSETHLGRLLKIATQQCLLLLPAGSDAVFAFPDEAMHRVNLYRQESKAEAECPLFKEIYRSELCAPLQEMLFDEEKKFVELSGFDQLPPALRASAALKGLKTHLALPLRKYGRTMGFALLSSPAEGFFNKGNYKFFGRVAHGIAGAVHSARLHAESRRKLSFEAWLEAQKRTDIAGAPAERGLDFCLASLLELSGAERTSLMRYDPLSRELRVFAAKGLLVYPIAGRAIKWGEGIAGLALKTAKPVAVSHLEGPKRKGLFDKWRKSRKHPGESRVRSLLCLPLSSGETPLGVVNISTIHYFKEFGSTEIEMASQITNRISEILRDLPPESLSAQLVHE